MAKTIYIQVENDFREAAIEEGGWELCLVIKLLSLMAFSS